MDGIETIPMVRAEPIHPGGPVEADVHRTEVANWMASGWRTRMQQPDATTGEESGDSAPDGGQEGTAPADEGADASAPSSEAIDKKQRAKK